MNLRFLFLASLMLLAHPAFASTEEAEKHLQTAVNEVLVAANRANSPSALASSLTSILPKYISFETMTRRAVGPGWRTFTSEQQKKATQLFTTLIIRSYSAKFTPGTHPEIKYKTASEPAPGRVEVATTILYEGSHYEVIYRLEQADGWRITDVVIEGVSLIANYRTQFDAQFKNGGAEAVISALNQSVGSR